MRLGLLFRWQSFWIGAHYARTYRRLCINIVPMVTVWIAFRGGVTPREEREVNLSLLANAPPAAIELEYERGA